MTLRLHPTASTDHAVAGYAPGFVERVLTDVITHHSRIHAIGGLQGTGKSTLAAQLVVLARSHGLHAVALSIDDFYLGKRERLRLGRDVHPLLATRGPPGTHDVALACETLDALRDNRPTRLPRFDKIADRRLPPSRWTPVRDVDLAVFEGWFLKVPAQSPDELCASINPLERDEDRDGIWRRYCNDALGRDYPPLWSRLDRLLWLQAPRFEVVPGWRWQQELTLQAANPGRRTMTRPQVERFVQLFERISRQALRHVPALADWSQRLDAQRRPH